MPNPSRKHHYIPEFLIKGFESPDNCFWLYNKEVDRIERRTSASQFFFEWDRNTINIPGIPSDFIEEKVYSSIDAKVAPMLSDLRKGKITSSQLLTEENMSMLLHFRVSLFWRVPASDEIFSDYFQRGTVRVKDKNNNLLSTPEKSVIENFKSNINFQKAQRVMVLLHTLEKFEEKYQDIMINHRIQESSMNCYALGDNPVLYDKQPSSVTDIVTNQVFFPISSNRIYYMTENKLTFDFSRILLINALIISQSVKYVCCADKNILQASIEFFKEMKADNQLGNARKYVFLN